MCHVVTSRCALGRCSLHNLLRLCALCVAGRDTAPLTTGLAAAAKDAEKSNPALGELVVPLADAGPLPPLAQHPAEAGAARGGGSPVPDWSGAETSVPKLPPLAS